jgi:hypothetical protein
MREGILEMTAGVRSFDGRENLALCCGPKLNLTLAPRNHILALAIERELV